ncbi:MAG: hypothetical protein ACUVS4_11820 [Chloroflexaceae bacterium]
MSNPYAYTARQPLALMVLLAAIVSGPILYWWLLPLGLLAYGAMVIIGRRSPAVIAISRRPVRPRLRSATFRAQLNAIERSQREIERAVAEASPPLAGLLTRIITQTRELVEQAYILAERGQTIETYLTQTRPESIQDRITRLNWEISSTGDPYTRQQLEETRAALLEKQRNADDLMTYIGRIKAQLDNIYASLDNVLSDTVRLRTADVVSASPATNEVAQRLADLKSDMDTFQGVLDTAVVSATS